MNKSVAYVALAVGVISIVYLLSIEEVRLFGVACRVIGEQTVRGPFGPMNEPVCLDNGVYFTGMSIGIFLVLFAAAFIVKNILFPTAVVEGTSPSIYTSERQYSAPARELPGFGRQAENDRRTERVSTQSKVSAAEGYDRQKWATLIEYDEVLRAANAEVGAYGASYSDKLARDFLGLNDKSYLPKIVEKIKADAEAAIAMKQSGMRTLEDALETGRYWDTVWYKFEDDVYVAVFDGEQVMFSDQDSFKQYVKDKWRTDNLG